MLENRKTKSGLVLFVENTSNITKFALADGVLSFMNFYKDSQMPGAIDRMQTEVDPFFVIMLVSVFVAATASVLDMYEKNKNV
jgi:hypothetical protein